jgi:hypothetical protein
MHLVGRMPETVEKAEKEKQTLIDVWQIPHALS